MIAYIFFYLFVAPLVKLSLFHILQIRHIGPALKKLKETRDRKSEGEVTLDLQRHFVVVDRSAMNNVMHCTLVIVDPIESI